jgi:MFS family permease
MSRAFRSLKTYNYRLWAAGCVVSNVGTWMQRTAQDWLVLTELTHHNASAVGTVMALQFGPQLLLLPWTGWVADHVDQRRLMMVTQAAMGTLSLLLGAMTLTGVVALWHVYVFAFLFGCASAFDAPVRQTFVAQLVGDADLPNAIALNSTSFNAARMIGPAAAGLLIAGVGTGWAFIVNGLSYVAILGSLTWLRKDELHAHPRAQASAGGRGMLDGMRYVWKRPDLMALLAMLFLIATFGLNFPIFIGTMAVSVFHTDARGYSLLCASD